ncbi:hypothetical protein Taro_053352 [Colocasia esculenta]|uniref:Uncharacterized protein n=1 Tax=Colocasia esculenta TaxID=4460 RepID=A0A843XKY0_COLES|nr:hypothetical protein [Colocasia esculenta]
MCHEIIARNKSCVCLLKSHKNVQFITCIFTAYMTVKRGYKHCRKSRLAEIECFMQKPQITTYPNEGRNGGQAERDRLLHRSPRPHRFRQTDRHGKLCRDGPVNAAYRAVAFTGSTPESNRERTLYWIAGQTYPI